MTNAAIDVAAGAEFAVRLAATPSTGYLWEAAPAPAGVQLLGSAMEAPAGGGAPGDPAQQVFRWRALQAGSYVLHFTLKRRWVDEAVATHVVTVDVS